SYRRRTFGWRLRGQHRSTGLSLGKQLWLGPAQLHLLLSDAGRKRKRFGILGVRQADLWTQWLPGRSGQSTGIGGCRSGQHLDHQLCTDSVYVFLGGDPNHSVFYQQYSGSQPFGIVLAADGTAWVTNGGGLAGQDPRSVAKYALVNGTLHQEFLHFLGQALKGLALDSQGNAWVTSQGNSTIYALRPDGTQLGKFIGGGINGPWGIAVDGQDNLWVANFGPLQPGSNFTSGRISELCVINL